MAIEDMFLKMRGVTGEAEDADHKGEVEVVSWAWGMQAPAQPVAGAGRGRTTIGELVIRKRVDQSSPTLMRFLRNHKLVSDATLSVRKAGKTPLEYFKIEIEKVRVTSLNVETDGAELMERVSLGFAKVKASYVPQADSGAKGGGENVFEADAHTGE